MRETGPHSVVPDRGKISREAGDPQEQERTISMDLVVNCFLTGWESSRDKKKEGSEKVGKRGKELKIVSSQQGKGGEH